MRRKVTNRNIVGKDYKYDSEKIGKFINYVMLRGQKETARKVVYDALDLIKEKTKSESPEVRTTKSLEKYVLKDDHIFL